VQIRITSSSRRLRRGGAKRRVDVQAGGKWFVCQVRGSQICGVLLIKSAKERLGGGTRKQAVIRLPKQKKRS